MFDTSYNMFKTKKNSSLERKNDTKVGSDKVKNSACNKCQSHESKIVELN